MLQQELDYFIANQDQLVQQYRGRILVLKDQAVVGVYDTLLEAYFAALRQFTPGTFMLQRCEPGEDAYTVTLVNHNLCGASP